jgi:HlyD family secretion protein
LAIVVLSLLVAGAASGAVLWHSIRATQAAAPALRTAPAADASALPVAVARAVRRDLPLRAQATGHLEPWRRVELRAETGGRIVELPVREGEWVAAGELLVGFNDVDRRLELAEAEAELLRIQAGYAVEFESPAARPAAPASTAAASGEAEKLYREGLLSRRELEAARHSVRGELLSGARREDVRAATTGLTQAEQRLARARLGVDRSRLLAPFAGRVADLEREIGQHLSPGEPIATLLDDDRLKVDVEVLETDRVRLRPGGHARVRVPAFGERILDGIVLSLNPRIDPDRGSGRVTVAIENRDRLLLGGLFAYVELEVGRLEDRLLVPEAAVLHRQERDLVFRVENGRVLWTWVRAGPRSDGWVEILEGLDEGELVAVDGHFALAHEARVVVEPRAAAERVGAPR